MKGENDILTNGQQIMENSKYFNELLIEINQNNYTPSGASKRNEENNILTSKRRSRSN